MAAVTLAAGAGATLTPLPLGKGANTAFTDREADDRQGGWTDEGSNDLGILKPGRLVVSGVPFDILGDEATGGKSCIVLGGPKRDYLPAHARIKVAGGPKAKFLYLLHGAAWCPPAKSGRMTGLLLVEYTDGSALEQHVRFGRDVGDWNSPKAYPNAFRAWSEYNGSTQVSLFVSRFALDAGKEIKEIRLVAVDSAWMVVAATIGGEVKLANLKQDLTLDKKYVAPVLDRTLPKLHGGAAPKNIILLIGDGMGPGAIQLTSLYQHGAEGRLVMEQFPVHTRCVTLSQGENVTDSAASATAIATGHKTKNSHLGLTPDKQRLRSVAEAAHRQGRAVAIITSDSVIGATPAGFYAHVPSRGMLADVALDAWASGFEILIGNANGRPWFLEKSAQGQREDGRNLIREMEGAGYTVIASHEDFSKAPPDRRVLGFIDKNALSDERCLAGLFETAVARLEPGGKGFFMMLECATPDGGGHGNNPELSVRGTLQMDWAAKAAVDFATRHPDTLIMVTADHETGALSAVREHGKLKLSYDTTSHTGIPVRLLAFGPGSEKFDQPLIDNTEIAKTIDDLWSLELPPPGADK